MANRTVSIAIIVGIIAIFLSIPTKIAKKNARRDSYLLLFVLYAILSIFVANLENNIKTCHYSLNHGN